MAKLTALYNSADTVDNVVFDLIGSGIPRDKIVTDKTSNQVEVEVPDETAAEMRELLHRHQPKSLS